VITHTADSWVATANVVLAPSARTPVFVDVDPATRNIDLGQVERRSRHAPRAASGRPWPACRWTRDRLYDDRRPPPAARHRGRRAVDRRFVAWAGEIGSIGDLVSFSFHANKNLTTAEGGCLVLNDAEAEAAARSSCCRLQGVKRAGRRRRWTSTLVGGKHNLTDVAAAIGLGQLPPSARVQPSDVARSWRGATSIELDRAGARPGLPLPGGVRATATGTCSSRCCPLSAATRGANSSRR
jgi:hypothetical protein